MNDEQKAKVKLSTYLCYKDPAAAIEWLCDVLGFEKVVAFDDEERGGIAHAELRMGDAVIMIQTDYEGFEIPPLKNGTSGHGMYLILPSKEAVMAAYEQAEAKGANVFIKPTETEWGNFRFDVQDPEGYVWGFGIHDPGYAVEGDW